MGSKSFIVYSLAAVMVVACVDTIPDPPAVNPHRVSITSTIREACGAGEWRSSEDCVFTPIQSPQPWAVFTTIEPQLPNDLIIFLAG